MNIFLCTVVVIIIITTIIILPLFCFWLQGTDITSVKLLQTRHDNRPPFLSFWHTKPAANICSVKPAIQGQTCFKGCFRTIFQKHVCPTYTQKLLARLFYHFLPNPREAKMDFEEGLTRVSVTVYWEIAAVAIKKPKKPRKPRTVWTREVQS